MLSLPRVVVEFYGVPRRRAGRAELVLHASSLGQALDEVARACPGLADLRTAADRVYSLFGPLAQRRKRLAQTLSGGERQMLAIGRALMSRPKVLLLDEPSLGLAPRVTAEIMAVVRGLRESENLTVLLVEQNARSALSIADRAVVLNVGRVVVDAPAGELAADASLRHAYLGF